MDITMEWWGRRVNQYIDSNIDKTKFRKTNRLRIERICWELCQHTALIPIINVSNEGEGLTGSGIACTIIMLSITIIIININTARI
jgi:hypothetical protein